MADHPTQAKNFRIGINPFRLRRRSVGFPEATRQIAVHPVSDPNLDRQNDFRLASLLLIVSLAQESDLARRAISIVTTVKAALIPGARE